jgi:hypothetical protein
MSTAQELSCMRKGEGRRHSSTQVMVDVLNEENNIRLIQMKVSLYSENLFDVFQANSLSRKINLLKIQSGSKSCSFGVDSKW